VNNDGILKFGKEAAANPVMIKSLSQEASTDGLFEIWFQKELCQVQDSSHEWFNLNSPDYFPVKCLPWNPLEVPNTSLHAWIMIKRFPVNNIIGLRGFKSVGWTIKKFDNSVWIYIIPGGYDGFPYEGWHLSSRDSTIDMI